MVSGAAFAALPSSDIGAESAIYAGTWTYNYQTKQSTFMPATALPVSNLVNSGPAISAIPGTANAAFSNPTAANPTYGDDYFSAGGGTGPNPITSMRFSLFNSSSTTSGTPTPITAATAAISVYNEDSITAFPVSSNPALGSFTVPYDFSAAPLAPGFFTILTVTGLDSLNMVLPGSPSLTLITQKMTVTGSTRHGIVSVAAPTVGTTGGNDFYMFPDASAPAGEGFYTSGATPVNVAYELVVAPEPTSLAALSLGGLLLRRRRA